MQLTRFADYSLRVLIHLAGRSGAHTTIRDIAEAHRISESHLMKVVHRLALCGYVTTVRGNGGGVGLAREAADISVGSVIRDVESLASAECLAPGYGAACKLYPACSLRSVLQAAQDAYLRTLDECSISDVAGGRRARARHRGPRVPRTQPPR